MLRAGLLEAAIANNARWCDAVCRTHGIRGEFDDQAWSTSYRSPPLYPDAVTLSPEVDAEALLSRVDASDGCSIKDSYADVDLRAYGLSVLFDAQWIAFPDVVGAGLDDDSEWARITTSQDFTEWERAWRGDTGPADVLRSRLLGDDQVMVLGEWDDDRIVSGCVLFATEDAIGVSNVFALQGRSDDLWPGVLRAARLAFPGLPIVGYESADALAKAVAAGAAELGPLQVWVR